MLNLYGTARERAYLKGRVSQDPYIAPPDFLEVAKHEVKWNYKRPPGYIHDMIDKEISGHKGLAFAKDGEMEGIITELCLLDRLYWLRDKMGWDITFLEEPFEKIKYSVIPGRPGKRVEVYRRNGPELGATYEEFDAAALIEGTWTLIEGKTGHNLNMGTLMTKINRFNNIVVRRSKKDGPACILGLPMDHRAIGSLNLGRYQNKGVDVWKLRGLYSGDVEMMASEQRTALQLKQSEMVA